MRQQWNPEFAESLSTSKLLLALRVCFLLVSPLKAYKEAHHEVLQKLLSKLLLNVHTQGRGEGRRLSPSFEGGSAFKSWEKLQSCCLSNTWLWTEPTMQIGFLPLYWCIFEVCSASSDIVAWKLSLSPELKNLEVKWSGPNWLIFFFFFSPNGPNHYDLVWQSPILCFPVLISPCDH